MLGKDLINKQMEDRIVSFVESKALLEFVNGSYSYLSIVYEVFAIEEVTTCHKKVAEKVHRITSIVLQLVEAQVDRLVRWLANC